MSGTLVRRAVLAGVLTALVLAAWTLLALQQARADLLSARSQLERSRDESEPRALLAALVRAEQSVTDAGGWLRQPGPVLARAVPVLGRPVDAVDAVSEATLAVVRSARRVSAAAASDRPLVQDGRLDLAVLADVETQLRRGADEARRPVQDLAATSPDGLGPLGDPVREAQGQLTDVLSSFDRGAAGLQALRGVLGADGPRQLLLVLQNNAELRGTGGLVSVFAQAVARDGRLELTAFRDVEDVADPPTSAVRVPAPPDYRALWGPFLADSTLWKNTNMAPDVPTSSAVLAEVAARSLGTRPDAVVWLDVPAIGAVLRATGPAELADGTVVDGDDATAVLLSEAYAQARDDRSGQAQRRGALRSAADAVVSRVLGSGGTSTPVTRLGRELGRAAAGRHVAVWSAREDEQRLLEESGLSGAVPAPEDDLAMATVQNLGGGDQDGNKLDYYARRVLRVDAEVSEDRAVVRQTLVLRNEAPPEGLPSYVAGTGTPGSTNNLVTLAVPRAAQDVAFTRGEGALPPQVRPSGDHGVLTDVVRLPPGTSATWTVSYVLPLSGGYRLAVVPQPLAVDAEVSVDLRPAGGTVLSTPPGSAAAPSGDALRLAGPLSGQLDVEVGVRRPGALRRALDAVREFWQEPVPAP